MEFTYWLITLAVFYFIRPFVVKENYFRRDDYFD